MSLIQSYRPRRPPLQRNPPNDTQSLVEAMPAPSDLMSNLTVTFTLVTAPTDLSVAASDLSAFNCNLTAGDFVVTTVWLRLNSELVAGERHCQFPRQRRDADRGPALVDLP